MIGLHSRSILGFSRPAGRACIALFVLLSIDVRTIAAADSSIRVELNAAESLPQSHCRLTFVIENSARLRSDRLDSTQRSDRMRAGGADYLP
jgi:hypothetical protein